MGRDSPRRTDTFLRLAGKSDTSSFQHFDNENSYLATCIPGLAGVLAEELSDLGCHNVRPTSRANSAVTFTADTRAALSTLLWSRTAHKVLELLVSTTAAENPEDAQDNLLRDRDGVYNFIRNRVAVKSLLGDGKGGLLSLSVQVILNNPKAIPKDINHSHFTALTIKNALCDEVRDKRGGDRPSVDLDDPDCPLVAILLGGTTPSGEAGAHVSLYRQLHATGSLHKRGYRQFASMHKAAMKESMAAGLLLHARWPEQCRTGTCEKPAILLDPMAGSGSLVLEAAMMAADLAPGLMRIKCNVPGSQTPPILRWRSDNEQENMASVWRDLLMDATQRARNGLQALRPSDKDSTSSMYDQRIYILANELHPGAIGIFESSLEAAGLAHVVQVEQGDCKDWDPISSIGNGSRNQTVPWTVVANPPWGVRLTDDMHESWEALRFFIREGCPPSSQIWVLSGNSAATKHLSLRRSQSVPIKTGQHDLRWLQYILRDAEGNDPHPRGADKDSQDPTRERVRVSPQQGRGGYGRRNDAARRPFSSNDSTTRRRTKDPATTKEDKTPEKRPWEIEAIEQREENEWLI